MGYDFADRLIEMRRSRGFSQEELARDLGVSRQAISKWERAESTPDISNLVALADIYGVSLDDLVRNNLNAASNADEPDTDPRPEKDYRTEAESIPQAESNLLFDSQIEDASTPPPPPDDAVPVHPAAVAAAAATAQTQTQPSTYSTAASFSQPAPAPMPGPASAPGPAPTPAPVPTPTSTPASAAPAKQKVKSPFRTFPYPVFIVLLYLILGFGFGLWHPGWIIFFTIPFYYWIVSVIEHDPEYIAHHGADAK